MSSSGRLAVIPARGGSKRVPGKNVRLFRGRPMIAWSVAAALESKLFDRVVVSTDSEEIAAAARAAGAETPFKRDARLSDDQTPVSAATADALERLDPDGRLYGQVAQLMANCPLRTVEDICASGEVFLTSAAESQISVVPYGWQNPWWALLLGPEGRLEPLFPDRITARSQDLPRLLCPTGAIWWARAETLRRAGTFHVEGRTGWEIDWSHAVDIDTEEDWAFAEALAERSDLAERARA